MVPTGTHQQQSAGRSTRVPVRASDVVRLWAVPGGLSGLRARNASQRKAVRIAAVLPNQGLALADYEVLEALGVLVVQIPADVPSGSNAAVARYLTEQLRVGSEATAARMTALGTVENVPNAAEYGDTGLSREEEEGFLEFLNDPANQLGAP